MKSIHIGDLTIKVPIIQGGMGIAVSLSNLAAAVANEGGVGVISAVGIGMTEPNYRKHYKESNKVALRKEIQKARAKTSGILGVNVMMAVSDFDDLLHVAVDEEIDIAFIGAGLFLKDPSVFEKSHTKFVPKVSSVRVANLIFSYWDKKYNRVPDAIVVEGNLCGGHIGFAKDEIFADPEALNSIIPEVVKIVKPYEQKYGIEIPVIAAGGIYSGKEMYDIMQLGANGVKMGTRFVTSTECDVSDEFKQAYISCTEDDIVIIDSPVGMPGRVISNDFVKDIIQDKKKPVNCPWQCLKTCDYRNVPFCISEALFNAAKGDLDNGFCFAGSNAYRAKEIQSVKSIFDEVIQEYNQQVEKYK
ncbi:MAG: nitronate monooxygenase family protein [Bacteroidales bacterium]